MAYLDEYHSPLARIARRNAATLAVAQDDFDSQEEDCLTDRADYLLCNIDEARALLPKAETLIRSGNAGAEDAGQSLMTEAAGWLAEDAA
jgi:hypothetical protein